MKIKNCIVCLIALLALPVLGAFAGTPAGFSVQLVRTFDYPGSGNSTEPQGISDSRAIVGDFFNLSGVVRGFIRFTNGNFSAPLVDPNDTGSFTLCRGINNSRVICGFYDDALGNSHGFLLSGGTFYNKDIPGSTSTLILGINNTGDWCGSDTKPGPVQVAFLNLDGIITEFAVPGASYSLAYGINSSNEVGGYFADVNGVVHGYFRESDGEIFAPIDPAGSTGTVIFGINDSDWMVGRYDDSFGLTHGLLFIPPNRYVTYDFPGSTFTSLNGINQAGEIVGRYLDDGGIEHGIILRVVSTAADQSTQGVTPQRQSSQAGSLPSRSQVEEPAF